MYRLKQKPVLITLWILLAAVSAAGYGLLADWWQQQQAGIDWLPASADCQLGTGFCEATDGERVIRVKASADQFSAEQPFELIVETRAVPADQLWLQLEGVNMYMGVSRYRLQPLGENRYGLTVRLPTCSVSTMLWQAAVLAEGSETAKSAGPVVGYQFAFEATQS